MVFQKILETCTFGLYKGMKKKKKENYFIRATKEDNNINPMYLFLLVVLGIGILLLLIPVVGMLVDIIYNHTMTINLSDMALYIGAVAAMFTGGGAAGALTEYSYSKYNVKPLDENGVAINDQNGNGIPDEDEQNDPAQIDNPIGDMICENDEEGKKI